MKPFEYTDADGDLSVKITPGKHGDAQVRVYDAGESICADVPPLAVPDAAVALYEAAGLPKPVILPGTVHDDGDPLPIGTADRNAYLVGCSVWVENGRVYLVQRNPVPGFERGSARLLAAAIAVHASAIPELDSAEVDRLADVISAEDYDLDYESRHALARTILLGGWKREPQA